MPEPKCMGEFCRQLIEGLPVQERNRTLIVRIHNIAVQNPGQKVLAHELSINSDANGSAHQIDAVIAYIRSQPVADQTCALHTRRNSVVELMKKNGQLRDRRVHVVARVGNERTRQAFPLRALEIDGLRPPQIMKRAFAPRGFGQRCFSQDASSLLRLIRFSPCATYALGDESGPPP
jgi:hypothetical protein